MGYYRIAEACPNGHVSTNSADANPEFREKFCSKCGEETSTKCSHCNTGIRGEYYVEGVIDFGSQYKPPAFCHNCGNPFEWTQRRISSAVELVQECEELSDNDLVQFENDLKALTKDSPQVQVASMRFKKNMNKLGGSVANGVKEIIVNVLSETAKKAIWG